MDQQGDEYTEWDDEEYYLGNHVCLHIPALETYLSEKGIELLITYTGRHARFFEFRLLDVPKKMLDEVIKPWLENYCDEHFLHLTLTQTFISEGPLVNRLVRITRKRIS